tara:strand:+ start:657 stop:1124 length:468 start_codon:yes stop_codon:yes gene_type:complete
MNFLQYIREVNGQFNISVFSTLGVLGWAACAVLYFLLYNELDGSVQNFVLSLAVLHLVEMVLVLVDAFTKPGRNVYLQTLVIGNGSFITFGQAAVLGYVMASDQSDLILTLSISSLAMACLSNALMLAVLFMLFHEANYKIFKLHGAGPKSSLIF